MGSMSVRASKVERVERIAFQREALRHMALEEVIDEAVHPQHRAARRVTHGQAHKGRQHAAVVVVRELELERLEPGQEAVRLPRLHGVRVPNEHAP